jgi:hypothetical protein
MTTNNMLERDIKLPFIIRIWKPRIFTCTNVSCLLFYLNQDIAVNLFIFILNLKYVSFAGKKSAESQLWDRFSQLDCSFHFKDLHYVGVQTIKMPTDFTPLKKVLETHILDLK